MSDAEDFHVHGAHDHAVQHAIEGAAQGGGHGEGHHFVSRIAVITAIFSTLGAMGSYQAGYTQNAALLYKNEAAIQKTAASDQWTAYQVKSVEEIMATLSLPIASAADHEGIRRNIERYEKEKSDIKATAGSLEAAAREAERLSKIQMRIHERWAISTMLLQMSIAFSAICLLTRKKWMLYGIYGAAGIGIGFGVTGMLPI